MKEFSILFLGKPLTKAKRPTSLLSPNDATALAQHIAQEGSA